MIGVLELVAKMGRWDTKTLGEAYLNNSYIFGQEQTTQAELDHVTLPAWHSNRISWGSVWEVTGEFLNGQFHMQLQPIWSPCSRWIGARCLIIRSVSEGQVRSQRLVDYWWAGDSL